MSLSTFGAILGFATEMVKSSKETYEAFLEKAEAPPLREALRSLIAGASREIALLEQVRRENVTEMTLEPIVGLERRDYEIEVDPSRCSGDRHLLELILALEERKRRFFEEASGKIPWPEISRIFKKIAKKKESDLEGLRSVEGSG